MRKNPLKGDNDSPKSNSPPPNNQMLNRYNSVSSIVSGGGAEAQGVDQYFEIIFGPYFKNNKQIDKQVFTAGKLQPLQFAYPQNMEIKSFSKWFWLGFME